MNNPNEKLLVLRAPSTEGDTWLSFAEPTWTRIADLRKRLAEGRYDRPFLMETRKTRSLCFGIDGGIQSEMQLDDPESLLAAYTRKMMGFLLFLNRPRDIVMIGLGGGSLAKFCHRHLPTVSMTVIEIDARVIALRSHFQIPPDDARLRVVHGDGSAYIAAMTRSNRRANVMLIDAFDRHGIAAAVTERAFLQSARGALSRLGIFVMNLVAERDGCRRCIEEIRSAFGDPVITVTVENDNIVVFAGPALQSPRRLMAASHNAQRVEARLGLRFPTLLDQAREFLSPLALQDGVMG